MSSNRSTIIGVVLIVLVVGAANSWWVRGNERAIGEKVAALAQPGDIRMISSENCAICLEARHWMTAHRVAFAECQIERDAACRAEFERLNGVGTPILVVRGVSMLGFDPVRLHEALRARG